MTKPILWLGPLEELDADFDPLLGRSATQSQPRAAAPPFQAVFDPARSVFDEPDIDPVTPNTPAPTRTPPLGSQNQSSWVETEEVIEPLSKSFEIPPVAPTARFDDIVVAEPLNERPQGIDDGGAQAVLFETDLVSDDGAKTDFTHNNDPIPFGKEPRPAPLIALDEAPSPEVPALLVPAKPKKTFFASLFGQPAIVKTDSGGNSIAANPVANIVSEPALTMETETAPADQTDLAAIPTDDVEIAPIDPSMRGRNIWAELEDAPAEDILDDTAATPTESLAEPQDSIEAGNDTPLEEPVTQSSDPAISDAPPIEGPIAQIEIEQTDTEQTETGQTQTSQTQTEEPLLQPVENEAPSSEPVDLELADLEPADLEPADLEPEVLEPEVLEPEVLADVEPSAPVSISASDTATASTADEPPATLNMTFQNAFNADQFWALPQGTRQPHREVDDIGDAKARDANIADTNKVEELRIADNVAKEAEPDLFVSDAPVSHKQDELPVVGVTPKPRPRTSGTRRKKKVKKSYIGAFFGTVAFSIAAFMTFVSSLADLGYPFDLMSSYRWYWIILSIGAAAIWGLSRGWKMVAASFAIMAANLFVTFPALGNAPSGGNSATAVVGWANVAGNTDALARVFNDADRKKATLLMLAEAPANVATPPAGWTLIEAPVAGDPTAIAVLSRSTWRAATVPGEPTMARPIAGDLTVIGVHPVDAIKSKRRTSGRDALINRAGARAGIQEGPTVVVGDFNAASWDGSMRHFVQLGNVKRVQCGGWAGSTLTQAFGLIGVATDHAFVRDVRVTHCQLGRSLTGGNHKPIWLYVAPAPSAPATQP